MLNNKTSWLCKIWAHCICRLYVFKSCTNHYVVVIIILIIFIIVVVITTVVVSGMNSTVVLYPQTGIRQNWCWTWWNTITGHISHYSTWRAVMGKMQPSKSLAGSGPENCASDSRWCCQHTTQRWTWWKLSTRSSKPQTTAELLWCLYSAESLISSWKHW